MADGPALALQAGLVAALKADAGIAALVGARVYDEPPQGVVFPYVAIGALDVEPFRNSCALSAWRVSFAVEAHSRPVSGRVEATRIAEAIALAIDEQEPAITVAGHVLEWVFWQTQAVTRDADGESYIARVAFTASVSTG